MEIYTVGHSNLSLDDFLELLRRWRIEIVADVRRFPTSRKHPHFAREALESALREARIRYVFLGEELGGYRREGYEAHMGTEKFRRGLERLEELAAQGRTTIMCAERDPRGCHRRFIAAVLAARGFRVIHILGPEKSRAEEPPLL